MPGLPGEIAQLCSMPGRPSAAASSILARAAAAHDQLLRTAFDAADPDFRRTGEIIRSLLPPAPALRRQVLCDPVFVEGVHELSAASPAVRDWRECTAGNPPRLLDDRPAAPLLGTTALALLLRNDPAWCGTLLMRTDCFGLLRFPLSDWVLSLRTADPGVVSEEPVSLRLTAHDAVWALGRDSSRPFLSMQRLLLHRLVAVNDPAVAAADMRTLDPQLAPRWELAVPLCRDGVRFLPVHCSTGMRAGICGGLVKYAHDEVSRTSPAIHAEFCGLIRSILGFDLDGRSDGIVQSFSEPTRPRLVGFNVPFTPAGQPRLCPFFVTWLGHELGHSKLYLIGSIGWHAGWRFLHNPGDPTGLIPRYGRSLSVRTLFQIPYTHLYEWTLLMDAYEAAPDRDPAADPIAIGDDLRAEIEDAFERLESVADFTPCGRAAMTHFRQLFAAAERRWHSLRFAAQPAAMEQISHR